MSEILKLDHQIARAVLVAPDVNKHTQKADALEVPLTRRPRWSNIYPYAWALPGGKFNREDFKAEVDVDRALAAGDVKAWQALVEAGLQAVLRELWEELTLPLTLDLLHFAGRSTNKQKWTTYTYVARLQEKPMLTVPPESAGVQWIGLKQLIDGNPKLMPGHLRIIRDALRSMGLMKEE